MGPGTFAAGIAVVSYSPLQDPLIPHLLETFDHRPDPVFRLIQLMGNNPITEY